jgi:hypothetical protein
MARGMIGLAVVVILTAMLPGPGEAQQALQVQQLCWALNPFVDTVLLEVVTSEGVTFPFNGRLLANAGAGQQAVGGPGPASYQVLGSGTATTSVTLPNSFEAGFQGVHNTPFFGGNRGCNFFAVIDNLTFNGTWTVQCPGPAQYTRQGALTFVSPCPGNF